jgi:hypothetical protein
MYIVFLFSLPYSASLVFPLLFVPFYLLGSLPETVFFAFLPCLTHPVLFLYFFPFRCLELYQNFFFLLFSYIATYVHAWNFTMVSLTLCFSFTFFPFRCLELYQKLFFLLFSYVATYVHAWNFTMVSLTLCFSFTFFPFRCLELYQKLFFLLFSYFATYVHAWNFTRSCSFSTFLPMSVATYIMATYVQ